MATTVKATEDLKQLVTVKLFKDNDRYKDDVFVSVNGNNFQIQRGVEVKVPMYVKLALDNANSQKQKAEEYASFGWKSGVIKQEGKEE